MSLHQIYMTPKGPDEGFVLTSAHVRSGGIYKDAWKTRKAAISNAQQYVELHPGATWVMIVDGIAVLILDHCTGSKYCARIHHINTKQQGNKMAAVTTEYLMGIKEGRECLEKNGTDLITVDERIANLKSTIRSFSLSSPVGQMLRGELDFWMNQKRKQK